MNIAITGSKGYVGSALVKALMTTKYDLYLYDLESWDIKSPIKNIIKNIDVVIHLAAIVSIEETYRKPDECFKTNFEGTKNVINAFPNAKIIFASSATVCLRRRHTLIHPPSLVESPTNRLIPNSRGDGATPPTAGRRPPRTATRTPRHFAQTNGVLSNPTWRR